MKTVIQAKKDLYNVGKCFVKGEHYTVNGYITNAASLMEKYTTNELNEMHLIGSWWREFKIVCNKNDKGQEI